LRNFLKLYRKVTRSWDDEDLKQSGDSDDDEEKITVPEEVKFKYLIKA